MHNASKSNRNNALRNSTIGVLFSGLLFFSCPYTVFADNPPDLDDDGIADTEDNCPDTGNPHQYDLDGDGIGIVCDNQNDQDNDGVADGEDNCPAVANPKQYDLDHDGIGIVCDNRNPDQDNDGVADGEDNCPAVANPKQYDLDHDGIGIVCDEDTIDDRAAVNRALYAETQETAARTRAVVFEAKAMRARERYIAFEANAMAAREREKAAARRQREQEIRQRNAPGPMVGCEGCHSNILPEVRQVVGAQGDFGRNSHHVRGTVASIDCLACHYTGDHRSGIVKLVDPDQGTAVIYEYDPAAPEEIEPFCLNCHDSDGSDAGLGTTPFSDQVQVPNIKGVAGSLWADSAHKTIDYDVNGARPITCLGDGMVNGCHANGHGSANAKILAADSETTLDRFCYNCHTEGKVMNNALSGSTNDIEQAFSSLARHDVGTPFTVNGKEFTLQCTSCHNPHVVTGRHWDVEQHVSPVTRPDFTADPVTNPHAMGSTLWGAVAGEKMDDYAALGSGSGGWYFSVARGRTIQMDQPAVYQPPKTGSYPNFEFDGDILPDYTSLCLDCHTHRMGNHPPVNWGQGVECTDNSVDPPDQRVECGAQHGFGVAGKPYAMDTGSTFYGSSGNPDPIFQQWNVQRGRGAGQFMRWPYDSAERNAGINFVLSCTDCHEAHGSGIPSMLRGTVNNGPGSRTWNTMCNNCHYYYGYHHAGMSCATASCHEATSIHRILHTTNSPGTYLWTEPSKPTTTPEILSVESVLGSNELLVTFTEGVFTNSDRTGALEIQDFVLVDQNSDNPKTITGVVHTPGEATATVTLGTPLIFDDFGADTLATAGMSIWNVAGAPAGPWPVPLAFTTDQPCTISATSFQFNDPPGSAYILGEHGVMLGLVNNPSVTLPTGGVFYGDENQGTSIDFANNTQCLQDGNTVTIEAVFLPNAVNLDWEDTDGDGVDDNIDRNATFSRIFERKRNIKITLLHADYAGDNTPSRADRARIQVKYFVETASRHTCPDPQWPEDSYIGDDVRWHQINSLIDEYPVVNDHWYRMRVVFNSDKSAVPGSTGSPVDIFLDDLGREGGDEPATELWAGFKNVSATMNESSSCRWGALPGDVIALENQPSFIGTAPDHNPAYLYKGMIDWISWKPEADYTGVDDQPK